ncbi:MAG: hypothetical protein KDA91_12630 [Planctomycetaceae bacterium]|nr:hypothetical protein [Planctomycetaceae bacterium]
MNNQSAMISWLGQLRDGDDAAACQLWDQYFSQLLALTRQRLRHTSRAMSDEEDIVISAMKSFCIGLRNGRFEQLTGRESLWRVLLTITLRKIADKHQFDHRGKRDISRIQSGHANDVGGDTTLETLLSREPDPQTAIACADEIASLLERLEHDDLQRIALMKMEGFTNQEIAERVDCSRSSIERKLRTIRMMWSQE